MQNATIAFALSQRWQPNPVNASRELDDLVDVPEYLECLEEKSCHACFINPRGCTYDMFPAADGTSNSDSGSCRGDPTNRHIGLAMNDECPRVESGCSPPPTGQTEAYAGGTVFTCRASVEFTFCIWTIDIRDSRPYRLIVERFNFPNVSERLEMSVTVGAANMIHSDFYFQRARTVVEVQRSPRVTIRAL